VVSRCPAATQLRVLSLAHVLGQYIVPFRRELGINVGPLLVFAGQKTNLAEEVNEAYDSSLMYDQSYYSDGRPIRRLGMGVTADGRWIIHVFTKSGGCSLKDLQNFFMEFPGIWGAMAFDGGGSAGMIDKEIGTGVIGDDVRPMKTAFVMTQKDPIPPGFPS